MNRTYAIITLCVALAAAAFAEKQTTDADIVDDPALPRVLIIGDSVSIAYTPALRKELAGKANVHHPDANCGSTKMGLRDLDQWLGPQKWDIIHFNWGLHDVAYRYADDTNLNANGEYATPHNGGHQNVPPTEYEKNLRELVTRLKKTGAKLIFATTTPVSADLHSYVQAAELPYNKAALRVMKEAGVEVNDLWSFAKPQIDALQIPGNPHFTNKGSAALAKKIAESLRPALMLAGETPGRIPPEKPTSRRVMLPRVTGEWIHVYKPEPDIFPGPDSPRFKAGQRYNDWQVNDHAILKGPDGRWHAFGITHPTVAAGEPNPHEAEWLLFHAAAPAGPFKQQCTTGRWQDQPKTLPRAERPNEIREIHSPFIVRHDGRYWMFYGYSPIRYATSTDLWSWQPRGELFRQEGSARDPSVMHHDGLFYMSYTTRQSILVRTSRDLLHWSDPVTVFSLAPGETGGPEAPTLLAMHGGFYLIWCRWDAKLSAAGSTFQHRSFVYRSDTPLDFNQRDPVAELPGHAPELFQDEEGDWWISSAEWPFRGLSVAPLKWELRD